MIDTQTERHFANLTDQMTTQQQPETKPIRRIKRKDGTFAVTTVSGRNGQRLGTYNNATDCIKAYKQFLSTGNYHELE